jgi:hypothetical protein
LRSEVTRFQQEHLAKPITYAWGLGVNPSLIKLLFYAYWLAAVYDPAVDAEAIAELADLLRRSLHLGIDEGGAIGEGPNYGKHDALRWTVPAEILYRAGVADLWAEEPRLLAMLRYWAYLILPGRREVNPLHDSVRTYGTSPLGAHLLAARHTGDAVLQWIWETMNGRGEIPAGGLIGGGRTTPGGPTPECFSEHLDFAVLYEDDDAAAITPGEAGYPLSFSSGDFGLNVMRSSWDADALYFALHGSGRTPGCVIHQHVDGGHFSLFALGEAFSIDTGYGDSRGRYHSVMMPDGKEPPTSPLYFDNAWAGGRSETFAAGQHADYCRVNVSWQWDCCWNYRHALVVRAPGALPYVLVLDNVNYRNAFCGFDWLVNSEPGNRVTLDQEQVRAAIYGKTNRMEIAWAYPDAAEYQPAHRMELHTDEIDSQPLDHVRPGCRLGIGMRPRLRAVLWGHNGNLLSALVPRRAGQAPVTVERIAGPLQFGLVIHHGEVSDTVVASLIDRRLSIGGLSGEATLAIARRSVGGDLLWAAACDAYALCADGREVLPRQSKPVPLRDSR